VLFEKTSLRFSRFPDSAKNALQSEKNSGGLSDCHSVTVQAVGCDK